MTAGEAVQSTGEPHVDPIHHDHSRHALPLLATIVFVLVRLIIEPLATPCRVRRSRQRSIVVGEKCIYLIPLTNCVEAQK